MDILKILGRNAFLFDTDLTDYEAFIDPEVKASRFLVVGGAGTIGQAVVKEIFKRDPIALDVIDISENNLVELVRDIRSSFGYGSGHFATHVIDVNTDIFDTFVKFQAPYDYILNLSALKHVRSEKDPYTLMRLLEVNVMNAIKLAKLARAHGSKKYFSVSTDKAANPVNLMGASKRIMEKFLFKEASGTKISMARFANVAFSDGSLLYGFQERLKKFQPFSCPSDVKRYFLTANEAGKLCLLSTILGNNNDIYFPNSSKEMNLISFPDIVHRYLDELGYKPLICASEDDARSKMSDAVSRGMWPVFYFTSDTTGEKPFEEFHTYTEQVELQKFKEIGVIKAKINFDENLLDRFMCQYESIKRSNSTWSKESIIKMYFDVLPELTYTDLNKYLDERM